MRIMQIEADVVIIFTNHLNGLVFPIWECNDDYKELTTKAVQMALWLSEDLGSGITKYEIHDFRQ